MIQVGGEFQLGKDLERAKKSYIPERIMATLRHIEVTVAKGKTKAIACKEAGVGLHTVSSRILQTSDPTCLYIQRGSGESSAITHLSLMSAPDS